MKKYTARLLPSILFTLILLFIWELYSGSFSESALFLPAPGDIWQSFWQNKDIILIHTLQTCWETLIGFILAIILGLTVSILFTLYPLLKRTLYPLIILSQTIPLIALAPLLLIWFGFGLTPKIIMVILYCFFPVTITTTNALTSVNSDLIRMLKSMGASNWQIIRLVRLPSALPAFFSGVKIASAYSVAGAIAGEFVGGYQGLGIFMLGSAKSHAFSLVFASVIVTSLLSIILFLTVGLIERLTIPWYRQSNT